MAETGTAHPLAAYIAAEIHGEDEEIEVYGSGIRGDGKSVYIEGNHFERGEFWAEVEITGFGFVLDDES